MQESLAPAMSDVGLLLLALDEKFNNTGLLHRIDLIEIGWRTLRVKDVGGFYCNLIISTTSIMASELWEPSNNVLEKLGILSQPRGRAANPNFFKTKTTGDFFGILSR